MKTTARLTGVGYLIIFVSGFYANFFILEGLVVQGDAASTFQNVTSHADTFHAGVLSFLVMILADLILAWPLYTLFRAKFPKLALASSLLRVLNVAFFFVALSSLFGISTALNNGSLNAEKLMLDLAMFNKIWAAGLLVFGLHLLLLGKLLFQAQTFPKVLGVLIALAGFGYFLDSSAQLFLSTYADHQEFFEMLVVSTGIIGEFSFTLWLLVKGVRD